jgi:hypothetical protein
MLLVYGDESLDETQSRVCAVAGVIGPKEMWDAFEPKWKERNRGVPFHANDCDSDQGDYRNIPHSENKALYKDLTILLAESGLGGFASVLDLKAQSETFPAPFFEPPLYYQSFMGVLEAMRNAAENQEDFAELTFDNRIESNFNAAHIYGYLRESHPRWKERLASKLSFESSRDNPRIQVADLFAREAMKSLDNEIGPVPRLIRRSWKALQDTGRFKIEKVSKEHFNDPNIQPTALMDVLGFTLKDYADWLEINRRPNGYTSYLDFLIWHRQKMTPEQLDKFNSTFG